MTNGSEFVAERFEQSAEKCLATTAWDNSDPHFQRKFCIRKLLPHLASSADCGSKRTSEGNARERGGYIGTIVDVLV